MKSRFIVLLALFAILLSSCSLAEDITPPPNYQSPTPAPTMSPLFPANPPDLTSGATIFATECAPCHGEKGLGDGVMAAQLQKPPVALGKPEIARVAAPANWYATVTQGNMQSFMPPFNSKLSDQQRWDVVAYAISLSTSSDDVTKGKAVYEANCAQCHGLDGKAGQQADLTDQALMAKLTQNDIIGFVNKGVGTMPGLGGAIADADVYAVAAYVRTFTFPVGQLAASAPIATQAVVTATPAPAISSGETAIPTPTDVSSATATPAQTIGNIGGKVTNGSGGAIPATLKAVLHTFDHDTTTQQFNEAATQEAPVAADGTYMFANLSMTQSRAYYVSVDYAGTTYESDPAIPQKDGKTSYNLPISIYDTTTDASGLAADQVHVILDYSKPDLVQVIEFFIIANPGAKTVVAAEKGGPVIQVPLPKGYANLQFQQGAIGDRYLKTDNGFADTGSVSPGAQQQYQIVFAFELPLPKPGLFGGQKLEFTQPIAIKANAVSVLVPEGVTVAGSPFTPGGTQDMGNGGGKFQVYNLVGLESGQTLDVAASGAPKTSGQAAPTGSNPTQNIIIGVGALGVVLILIGAWLFWRDRKRAAEADDEDLDDDENEPDDEDTDEILDAIVALDDQFKAGNISEEAYKERRGELKAKLKGRL
jgi:mono/diheme cytochrome c family protein